MKRPFGAFLLLVMIIMGAQVALKKPLCIDSQIVYKIDSFHGPRTEELYACSQFKKVSFSNFLYEKLDHIQARLKRVESALPPFLLKQNLTLQIQPSVASSDGIEVQADRLILTPAAMESETFEKAVLQWVLKSHLKTADHLYIETLVDFLATTWGNTRYRSLISEAWNISFSQLSLFQRRQAMQHTFHHLSTYDVELSSLENLQQLLAAIGSDKNQVSQDKVLQNKGSRDFADQWQQGFQQELALRGYLDRSALAQMRLDLIVEVPDTAKGQSIATALAKFSRAGSQMKVAIKTKAGLFLLPSLLSLPEDAEIFAESRLIFSDEHQGYKMNSEAMNRYADSADRLILVALDALPSTSIHYQTLLQQGVTGFLKKNRQLSFIQIHLPSYKLKSTELNGLTDYFAFVKEQDMFHAEKKSLGWQQSEWLKDLQAYKPVAHFDVIQYFRIN